MFRTTFLLLLSGVTPLIPGVAPFQVNATVSPVSPQPVGTPITISFAHKGVVAGPVTYRFEVQSPGVTTFLMVKDYDQQQTFTWAQNLNDGTYLLRITARDHATGNTSQEVLPYNATSRVLNGQAVVSSTTHTLVALFSAPPCPAGSTMKIGFAAQGVSALSFTNAKPCGAGSMNFLVAGMRPNYTHHMNYYVTTGATTFPGPATLTFQTGTIPRTFRSEPVAFPVPFSRQTSAAEKFQFNSFSAGAEPFAFDLNGNIVWFWPNGIGPQVQRLLPDGTFLGSWGIAGDWTGSGAYGYQTQDQIHADFDMLGNVVQETNADRINEQIPAVHPITHFNHDSIRLPNGNTLAIADIQQLFPAGTQGSTAPIGIIGTMLLELDQNLQVVWYWDCFDHDTGPGQLDITRVATLNDQCAPGDEGCPPVELTNPSNDWLHANTLQLQADGSLIVSLRNQDWIIDIDFGNGTGTQDILWRMGRQGDFTMLTNTPVPWFSHQHDTEFQGGSENMLTVFDNGNTRVAVDGGNSRGQVLSVNVPARTVSLTTNIDLGVFSVALGSAQILQIGDLMFLAGEVFTANGSVSQSIEVTPAGTVTYKTQVPALDYRCFRVADLYSPPNGAGVNLPPAQQ
jgi:hypothetical protein